jgi:hypothetical protein
MTKKEFFDKIDNIRSILDSAGDNLPDKVDFVLGLLEELRQDAELVLEEEYDKGYTTGADGMYGE